jgi:ATP-dependent Zn protease
MAAADELVPSRFAVDHEASKQLASQWRRLTRAATAVAVFTSPALFFALDDSMRLGWALFFTFLGVAAFRGLVDVVLRRAIPWPSLFGEDEERAKELDVVDRRRAWYWAKKYRRATWLASLILLLWAFETLVLGRSVTPWGMVSGHLSAAWEFLSTQPQLLIYVVIFPLFFVFNFLIMMGPMMLMGITQINAFEPGDADWGVKLEHVRGQAEAKEEVRRVVTLWQSGDAFELAGGKRERGLLMLGAPGTGKTMLSKAIATGFNCPFVSIPGSGFAQTFIGVDALIVRYLVAKARRLARKWGGQCIIFIDEIDAVGMRRSSLGPAGGFATGRGGAGSDSIEDYLFYGPNGALTPTGDLVLETRAWREKLFASRAPERPGGNPLAARLNGIVYGMLPGGMMGGGMGQLALNQLLVMMDGIGNPRFTRKVLTNRVNTFLDATYVVPRHLGKLSLRLPRPKPSNEQVYFIGACNVPIEMLDPALTRPGRMGRHIWFRTPTKTDRLDIFDLYLSRVSHDPELDTPKRREELARITNGYSPAMIEQVCSMALTIAHHTFREQFSWEDIVEAMTTIESGTAVNVEYVADETRAVAVHEAGHAVTAHVYLKGTESTRLSIRKRGASLGHHQALEKEERFSSWQHEEMGRLIWTLGAMAAERVFYGENSTGVGGDVQSATARAAWMVGSCAMAPERVELVAEKFESTDEQEEERQKILARFETIGSQIMSRAGGGGPFSADPIQSVLGDRDKRILAAQILGQAYMAAYHLVQANKDAVSHIADVLVEKRELHGDEVVDLLNLANLRIPEVDLTDERTWPTI